MNFLVKFSWGAVYPVLSCEILSCPARQILFPWQTIHSGNFNNILNFIVFPHWYAS